MVIQTHVQSDDRIPMNIVDRLNQLASQWDELDDPDRDDSDDDHPGSASGFAHELRTVLMSALMEQDENAFLLSRRDIKTQYGVQIWWKDPKGAGVKPEEWDNPMIFWLDTQEQADSFYLNSCKPVDLVKGELIYDDPPEVKNDIAKLVRYTRKAIEVYGNPEETP